MWFDFIYKWSILIDNQKSVMNIIVSIVLFEIRKHLMRDQSFKFKNQLFFLII